MELFGLLFLAGKIWAVGVLVSIFFTQFVINALGLAMNPDAYKEQLRDWKSSVRGCYNRSRKAGGEDGYCKDGNTCDHHLQMKPDDRYQQKELAFHCLWFVMWPLIGSDFFGKVIGERVQRRVRRYKVPDGPLLPRERIIVKEANDEVNALTTVDHE